MWRTPLWKKKFCCLTLFLSFLSDFFVFILYFQLWMPRGQVGALGAVAAGHVTGGWEVLTETSFLPCYDIAALLWHGTFRQHCRPPIQVFRPPPFGQCPNIHRMKFNSASLRHTQDTETAMWLNMGAAHQSVHPEGVKHRIATNENVVSFILISIWGCSHILSLYTVYRLILNFFSFIISIFVYFF